MLAHTLPPAAQQTISSVFQTQFDDDAGSSTQDSRENAGNDSIAARPKELESQMSVCTDEGI
jgi:hypothetical protein